MHKKLQQLEVVIEKTHRAYGRMPCVSHFSMFPRSLSMCVWIQCTNIVLIHSSNTESLFLPEACAFFSF